MTHGHLHPINTLPSTPTPPLQENHNLLCLSLAFLTALLQFTFVVPDPFIIGCFCLPHRLSALERDSPQL